MSQSMAAHAAAIYQVSVDSRSRPPGSPLYKYEVPLETVMQNVRSIQLGSWQMPSSINVIPCGTTVYYSFPINIGPNSRFIVQDTQEVTNNLVGGRVITTGASAELLLPPTLNRITAASVSGSNIVITTDASHGLDVGLAPGWPCQLSISIVGGNFVQDRS